MHSQAPHPAREFAQQAQSAFDKAAHRAGLVERFYRIAGQDIVLQFAGEALIPILTPALGHLERPRFENADLRVSLFDSETTQVAMPPPPWGRDAYGPNGLIAGFNTQDIQTVYNVGTSILNVMDHAEKTAVFWIRRPSSTPYWETAAPLRTILHWSMRNRSTQLVHGAAVGYETGGVLIAAKGGSGKSTSTLSCLGSDLLFAGDDYVAVDDAEIPFAHSLFQTAKLNKDNLARISHLGLTPVNSDRLSEEEKAVYFPGSVYPESITRGFPLRCILVPRVTGRPDTAIRPAKQAEALLSLAPTTLCQLPGSSPDAFEKMRSLARKLPAYTLEAGLDVTQIPRVIGKFLRSEFA